MYYKEAVAALVVYDITRPNTFEAVPKWKADLDTKVSLPDGQPIPVVLLANKVPLIVLLADGISFFCWIKEVASL